MELLRQNDMDDVLVVTGGIIPDEDVPALNEMGIRGIFGPGTPTDEIVDFIRENVA
jgi:methylmalonyl-CoA mutase C-terminal domain/subunit